LGRKSPKGPELGSWEEKGGGKFSRSMRDFIICCGWQRFQGHSAPLGEKKSTHYAEVEKKKKGASPQNEPPIKKLEIGDIWGWSCKQMTSIQGGYITLQESVLVPLAFKSRELSNDGYEGMEQRPYHRVK